MADNYRSHSTLINEARLLASAPETVAAWLAKPGRVSRWTGDADDELELKLLARNDRLIDLALSEHSLTEEVLRQLFGRDDEVLRAAVLSNRRFLEGSLGARYWTFVNDNDDLSWMAELSDLEVEALFSNPSLPDHFVSDFFEQKGVWEILNDDQRIRAASNVIRTLSNRPIRDDFSDGWADYSYSKVFDSAWTFSSLAPVNLKWAHLLGRLYSRLKPDTFSSFDPLQTAKRWRTTDKKEQELDREKEDNKNGYLGTFQSVRCGLARLAAHSSRRVPEQRDAILQSQDVAVRCAGYLAFDFSAQNIEAAVELDGKLACSHLIQNEQIWKKQETRSVLEEACRIASKGEDYLIALSRYFDRQEDEMREMHPDWFKEDDGFGDEFNDKPLIESSIGEVSASFADSPAFTSIKEIIDAKAKAESTRFWIILLILAVIAFR